MKCESCHQLLEEYIDGELAERESSEVATHLATCSACARETAALSAEQELFSRYDRDLSIPPLMWEQIAERTAGLSSTPISTKGADAQVAAFFTVPRFGFSLAAAAALVVFALMIFVVYLEIQKPVPSVSYTPPTESTPRREDAPAPISSPAHKPIVAQAKSKIHRRAAVVRTRMDQSEVLSSDLGYEDIDDQETAKHIEQTQNLLRSIRNVKLNDKDIEIDVSYDKALSRRLLNENIVLRRDAEMKAKYPTKMLLSDLEPFLIDIANLPDQAKPEDLRVIKERVEKTEIVAALIGY